MRFKVNFYSKIRKYHEFVTKNEKTQYIIISKKQFGGFMITDFVGII